MVDFNIPQFIVVAINMVVLYLVMRKLLFKPVTEFMEKRTKSIADSIQNAETAKSDALTMRKQYEEQLRGAKTEAEKIINDAKAKANKEADGIVAAAKQDAARVIAAGREEVERERTNMMGEIKTQVATLAIAAASKVIEANMNTETNKVLVNKFIDEAGVS